MRDLLPRLLGWWRADERAAVATVVRTFRSAPRPPGAAMAVGPGGEVIGSVSGGCVESAVYDLCLEVAESGRPVLVRYGVSSETAFEAGLTCGGTIEVFVAPLSRAAWPEFGSFAERVLGTPPGGVPHGPAVCLTTVLAAPGDDAAVGRRRVVAGGTLDRPGDTAVVREHGPRGEPAGIGRQVFLQVFAPPPRLLVFGAIDFATAMARAGRLLGYHVTVCDARAVFATAARFPEADDVVVDWPHRYLAAEIEAGRVSEHDAVCVLTHDPKFDVPLLRTALLDLPPGTYVGAMGSRRAHAEREARLLEDGVPPEALARLRSPIGLDLGARTPDETAVSIAAEMIAARSGASARPLRETEGPIHG